MYEAIAACPIACEGEGQYWARENGGAWVVGGVGLGGQPIWVWAGEGGVLWWLIEKRWGIGVVLIRFSCLWLDSRPPGWKATITPCS